MRKARAFDAAKCRDNPKMIAKYLNHALATGDEILIAQAIGDMIRAQGVTRVSQKIGLRRESLYRSFSGHSGPRFGTAIKAIVALNIQLVDQAIRAACKAGAQKGEIRNGYRNFENVECRSRIRFHQGRLWRFGLYQSRAWSKRNETPASF